jgi:hypothetical protein
MTLPLRRWSLCFLLSLAAALAFSSTELGLGEALAAAPGPSPAGIVLTQGVTYRARLRLSFFQCLASRARIEKKFGSGGFDQVRVFMSARDLPRDWPASYRRKSGSCERYAEGVWARPTMPRHRPSSIDAWWVAPAP